MLRQPVHYDLTMGGGRFTVRLDMLDNITRLYYGDDIVAEILHNVDGSVDILQGSMELVGEALGMRDVVLFQTAHLRN